VKGERRRMCVKKQELFRRVFFFLKEEIEYRFLPCGGKYAHYPILLSVSSNFYFKLFVCSYFYSLDIFKNLFFPEEGQECSRAQE
jgi:hypothetical protein